MGTYQRDVARNGANFKMPSLGNHGLRPCTAKKQPKNRYHAMKKMLLLFAAVAMFAACNSSAEGDKKNAAETEKSAAMQKAEALHEEALALSSETMKLATEAREAWMQDMDAYSDPVEAEAWAEIEKYGIALKEVILEIENWEANLTEIPGHAHDHSHDHGHDHAHDHNHEKERILEGLSDEEHLEIQQEHLNHIKKIRALLDATLERKP